MSTSTITRIRFKPEVRKDKGGYTAICHELQIAAAGSTSDEAEARLMVMVRSFLSTLQRKGLFEKALHTSGIMSQPAALPKQDGELVMDIETP